jgi:hypothetical protein
MLNWQTILFTFVSSTITGVVVAAAQNRAQGDDVRKSALGGLVGGIMTAVCLCAAVYVAHLLKINPIG